MTHRRLGETDLSASPANAFFRLPADRVYPWTCFYGVHSAHACLVRFHGDAIDTFQKFRTPGVGEEMILQNNLFVEGVLRGATVGKLSEEEMSVYRAPFVTPESRRPTWRFPNEIPIEGKPADVYAAMEDAHRALAQSTYPKLLFAGDPGAPISPIVAKKFAKGLKNCRFVQLSSGLHYCRRIIRLSSAPTSRNGSSRLGSVPVQHRS
jgi:hypothetical protein